MDKEEVNGCAAGCAACGGCGHDHEGFDDIDPIITLTDEEGNDVKFEIIDVVVLDDEREFLVVAEADKKVDFDDDIEVTILEIKEEDGEEVYDTVTDEELANKVFEEFSKNQDESDIEE